MYSELALREIVYVEGIKVGERNINNIRYAYDTVLMADSAEKLHAVVTAAKGAGDRRGLKINTSETESMVISKSPEGLQYNIKVGDATIEQVDWSVYLGSELSQDGRYG